MGDELFEWLKIHGKCCECEGSLEGSKFLNMVSLNKIATWKHPAWGNVLVKGSGGRALAVVCDKCVARAQKGFHVKFAIEIESQQTEEGIIYINVKYHPIEELEDTYEITEEMVLEAESKLYDFGVN